MQDRGTIQDGWGFVIALRCRSPTCGEEFRFGRSGLVVVDPADMRSSLVMNVLSSVSMLMRGNSMTRNKFSTALMGSGMGLSESAACEILQSTGVNDLVAANMKDCNGALISVIEWHISKCSRIANEQCILLEDALRLFPLELSFNGAYSHCQNASVDWGDIIAHVGELLPGFVTFFFVVGFVVKTRSRMADGVGVEEIGASQLDLEASDRAAPDLFSIRSHSLASSMTIEHAAFKLESCVLQEIMKSVQQICFERKVLFQMVLDGDLCLGTTALMFPCVQSVGLDRRHFVSTFRKWLVKALGGQTSSKLVIEVCDRIQAHFRWCCYVGFAEI